MVEIRESQVDTSQIAQFGKSLSIIVGYVLIGFILQRVGYLLPEWHHDPESLTVSSHHGDYHMKWKAWIRHQYRQWLVFVPIKYIGNLLYFIVLPMQYFVVLSQSLNASSSPFHDTLIFTPNLIICAVAKSFLLAVAGLFSILLAYSNRSARKTESGILTTEEDVTAYMMNARQILLHDHPLAKWCVFGLFSTSTLDIAIGVPLIESLFDDECADSECIEYTQYVYLYNVVQLLFVVPFCMLLLDIAIISVQHKYRKLKQQERVIKQTMALQREENLQRQQHRQHPHDAEIDGNYGNYGDHEQHQIAVSPKSVKSMNALRGRPNAERPLVSNPKNIVSSRAHHVDNPYLEDDPSRSSRDPSPTVPDSDSFEEDPQPIQHQTSAALNVFLTSISKAQHENQARQHQQDALRLSRLNRLANLPFQSRGSIHSTSMISPLSPSPSPLSPLPITTGPALFEDAQMDRNDLSGISPGNTENTETTFESALVSRLRATTRGLRKRNSNKKSERTESIQLPLSETEQIQNTLLNTTGTLNALNRSRESNDPLHGTRIGTRNSNRNGTNGRNRTRNGTMTMTREDSDETKHQMTCDNLGCRLVGRIVLNPMIIASVAAVLCTQLSPSTSKPIYKFLEPIASIYGFLSLMLVGGILSVLMEQRRSIFKFAAQTHRQSKSQILKRLNRHLQRTQIAAAERKRVDSVRLHSNHLRSDHDQDHIHSIDLMLDNLPSSPVSPPMYSLPDAYPDVYRHRDRYHRDYGNPQKSSDDGGVGSTMKNASVWTYSQSETGGIHFKQKRMTMTEIEDMMKEEATERADRDRVVITQQDTTNHSYFDVQLPTSISLMNTDHNVMMCSRIYIHFHVKYIQYTLRSPTIRI